MFTTFHCILEAHLQYSFYLWTRIEVCIISFVVILIFLTEIHTACQFTNTYKVSALNQFVFQRRFMKKAFECLYRTDISKQAKLLTHCQQTLFRTDFCCRVIVKFRITDSSEQYSVSLFAYLECFFRKRVPYLIYSICTTYSKFIFNFMAEFFTNGFCNS